MSRDFSEKLRESIRIVPDFPKAGINYFDITTALQTEGVLRGATDAFEQHFADTEIDIVAGIEARGFIFGATLAERLNCSFVPIRKPGKLPYKTESISYSLEYGEDTLEIHSDAATSGAKVLLIDDLLATGGTAAASLSLLGSLGADVVGCGFLIELQALKGRKALNNQSIYSILKEA